MFVLGAFSVIPLARLSYSVSGVGDFVQTGNHLLSGKVKSAAFSLIKGGAKLALCAGAVVLMLRPFFKGAKPSLKAMSEFKKPYDIRLISKTMQKGLFTKDSQAFKISTFCQSLFSKSSLSNRALVKLCLLPVNERVEGAFKDWLIEKPTESARRLFKTAMKHSLGEISSLKGCYGQDNKRMNVSQSMVSSSKGMLDTHRFTVVESACDHKLVNYLSKIVSIGDNNRAKELANRGCYGFFSSQDLCLSGP